MRSIRAGSSIRRTTSASGWRRGISWRSCARPGCRRAGRRRWTTLIRNALRTSWTGFWRRLKAKLGNAQTLGAGEAKLGQVPPIHKEVPMNKKLGIALAMGALQASALAYSAVASAQATFYEDEAFRGRSFTAQQSQVGNFERSELNNNASSAVIVGARWEVCSERRFGGNCMVLRPGRYPSLASFGMNDRISSARAVSANTRIPDDRYAPAPIVAQVTFFENENFGGRTFTTERPVDNFQRIGFNDRASSVEVIGERYEVCDDAGFRGNCRVLRPGRYPSLRSMGMNDRISSVRAVSPNTRIDDNRYAP